MDIQENQILEKFSDKWSSWGLYFKVEAEITVNSLFTPPFLPPFTWLNVFHFTYNGNENVNGTSGYRIPALFVHKDQYFEIYTANDTFYPTLFNFEFGKKYHIVLQQYQLEDKVIEEVKIDGNIISSRENIQPKSFPGMKLYISDPWHPPFISNYGLLENLKVTKYAQF